MNVSPWQITFELQGKPKFNLLAVWYMHGMNKCCKSLKRLAILPLLAAHELSQT